MNAQEKLLEIQKAIANEKARGDLNNAEIVGLENEEKVLLEQIAQDNLEQTKEQTHEQLQELVRGFNFNEVFAHPDANKIIHKLLYDESVKHLDALTAKDAENSALKQQLLDSDTKYNQAQTELEQLTATHAEKDAHIEKLTADVESMDELQKELRYERNQNAKLAAQVQDLQGKLDDALKQKSEFAPSQSLAELVESAKAVTEKRKLANVRPVDFKGSVFEGENEKGETERVSWLELPQIEQVQRFPEVAEQPKEDNQIPDVNQFQAEQPGTDNTPGLNVEPATNGADETPITRAEFEALKERVSNLEVAASRIH